MKRKLFDSKRAKQFMSEAGTEFNSPARRLIKDDYAALRQVRTATEMHEATTALTDFNARCGKTRTEI